MNLKPIYLRAVIRGKLRGLKNTEIAEKNGLNRNTVNTYVKALKTIPIAELLRVAASDD